MSDQAPAADANHRRFRFGLRTLFVVVALTALLIYWLATPTIMTRRYLRAIAEKDYSEANALFIASSQVRFPGDYSKRQIHGTIINLRPLTLRDLFHRERTIDVDVPYGEGMYEWDAQITLRATAQGIGMVFYQT